jgi:hypothetical protein
MFFLLALTFIASSPLFADYWFDAHDTPAHLVRLNNVCFEIRNGDLYPRWLSQASLGKGSPALNFYAPGFYLITGYLHILGFSLLTALKTVCFTLFFLGACGMFLWTKKYSGTVGSLISATLYLFIPYHFVDIYVRGALPEFAALAILPFLFYALDLSFLPERQLHGIVLTAITSATVILTHNISMLMISPAVLIYFGWRSILSKTPTKRLLIASSGPAMGIGLSAFYWLPVASEITFIGKLSALTSGFFEYSTHFLHPFQWISLFWGFGGPPDGMSFQIGLLLLVCVTMAAASFPFTSGDSRSFGFITLSLGLVCLAMTASLSSPLYLAIPILKYIQFPWRFLGPATFFLAAFSGIAAGSKPANKNPKLSWVLFGLIVLLSVLLSDGQRAVKSQLPVPLDHDAFIKYAQPLFMYWTEDDFTPKGATISSKTRLGGPLLIHSQSITPITGIQVQGSQMKFRVATDQASEIVVPWFNFPGWKAKLNGILIPVSSSPEGLITFSIPRGEHYVEVWFGTTWPRIAGWFSSVITISLIVGLELFCLRKHRKAADRNKTELHLRTRNY